VNLREFLHWAWNPPADRMVDHEFTPYDRRYAAVWGMCSVIPEHRDGHCPTPGRCQHNGCSAPRRYHAKRAQPCAGDSTSEEG
jgi:hypothetical protein